MAKPKSSIRQVIYVSDIRIITGKSESTASREIDIVKEALGIKKHQFLTIEAWCNYRGLDYKKTLQQLDLA